MVFQIYYRSLRKELRQFDADAPAHTYAIGMVEQMLRKEREPYMKPILAIVKGGKA